MPATVSVPRGRSPGAEEPLSGRATEEMQPEHYLGELSSHAVASERERAPETDGLH